MVRINGKEEAAAGKTIAAVLREKGYQAERVAVERNGNIVPKAAFGDVCAEDGDVLEIVGFVGGG